MTESQQQAIKALIDATNFHLLAQHEEAGTKPNKEEIAVMVNELVGILAVIKYLEARGFTTSSELIKELNIIGEHWYDELTPYIERGEA